MLFHKPAANSRPRSLSCAVTRSGHLLRTGCFLLLMILAWSCPAQPAPTMRIAVISDINGKYGSAMYHQRVELAVARIIEMKPDIVICTGDMVAGQRPTPKLTRKELETMWRSFGHSVSQPLQAAGIPLLVTPGNHDASAYPGYELERQVYRQHHSALPPGVKLLPGHDYPFHYAFESGDILFVSLDATTVGPLDDSQRNWIRDLAASPKHHRATIVFGHLPLQPVATGREKEIIQDPELEDLLATMTPSAYLSGHHHAYYPGWRSGIQMLATGNLGGNQRALTGTSQQTGFTFGWLEVDAAGVIRVTAFTADEYGKELELSRLPRSLGTGGKKLLRIDLAPPSAGH